MQQRQIKRSSVLMLFLGGAIFFDVIPWPGLGAGFIQTVTQSLLPQNPETEQVIDTAESLERLEVSTQNSFSASPRNDG